MYTVDLLNGHGTPTRIKPTIMLVGLITILMPIVVSIFVLNYYLGNNVDIKLKQKQLQNYKENISGLADVMNIQQTFEMEKAATNEGLREVYSSLGLQFQWSPVLELLARNMPDSIVMTQLAVKRKLIKKEVPKEDSPGEMMDAHEVERTLQMTVNGPPEQNCDEDVRDFMDKIRFSEKIGPKIKDISVSQEFEQIDSKNIVSYQIDCIFKSQL